MYYLKLTSGTTVIEFHNNWLGEETVIVRGQIVSKKSSILGTNHPFTVMENGAPVKYILLTKVGGVTGVEVDLIREGIMIQENVPVRFGSRPSAANNEEKKLGLLKLKAYDLDDAIQYFQKAIEFNATDPEVYFHMACAYSVKEQPLEGFECIRKAVEYNLQNPEAILTHDMLAFLRLHEAFQDFYSSGYTVVDRDRLLVKPQGG